VGVVAVVVAVGVGLACAMISSGICGIREQASLWQMVADESHHS